MKLVGWERSDHPHHAHEAPPAGCSKRVRCEARGSERGGVAELRRTSERPSNDADGPFSATCLVGLHLVVAALEFPPLFRVHLAILTIVGAQALLLLRRGLLP